MDKRRQELLATLPNVTSASCLGQPFILCDPGSNQHCVQHGQEEAAEDDSAEEQSSDRNCT
jgi:hypothetical protein